MQYGLQRVLGLALLAILMVSSALAGCPATVAPNPPFVPPAPNWPIAEKRNFWYGTADLWVRLDTDGVWNGLWFDGKGYVQKIFWFSRDFNWRKEPNPDMTVTSKRLDVDGPTLVLKETTHAILHSDISSMLTGADLPTTGCWEITGHYRGHTLSFVVSVQR
jgi:hypothetical protein